MEHSGPSPFPAPDCLAAGREERDLGEFPENRKEDKDMPVEEVCVWTFSILYSAGEGFQGMKP